MASLKGKFFSEFMYLYSNFNPLRNKDIVEKFRKMNKIFVQPDYSPEGFMHSHEKTPDGTKFERFRKNKTGKLIIYFHGGAYMAGLFVFYKKFVPDFYRASGGAEVIFLDYNLSPDYKYPSQLNEALDLWQYLTECEGYKPEDIILGGDSAGANLALATMLKLRDANKKLPAGAFCMSVWGDMTGKSKTAITNYGKDVEFGEIGKESTEYKRNILHNSDIYMWIGDEKRDNPLISPVLADYSGFPPMIFTVGGNEMLLDDTLSIVKKMKKLNIPVKCDVQPDMFHIYPIFRNAFPESSHSYNMILKYIHHIFK